jgi:hypothetical protein
MRTINIYKIHISDEDEVRYVGQTMHHLNTRLTRHKASARAGETSPFYLWLKHCLDNNIAVEISLLENVPFADSYIHEEFWINKLIAEGHPLLNKYLVY